MILIFRKKDLVKLQYGEYVSLGKVESVLKVIITVFLKSCLMCCNFYLIFESAPAYIIIFFLSVKIKFT